MNKIKKLACAILAASTLLNPMLSMAGTKPNILKELTAALTAEIGEYAALATVNTVCPQCKNIMTYLKQIQRSINQFNVNGVN